MTETNTVSPLRGLHAAVCGQVSHQSLEAVDGETVVGLVGGLLAAGDGGAPGLGDDAGSLGLGGFVIGLLVEHGGEAGAHVMLDIIGEHAEQDVGADPAGGVVEDRTDFEIDGLQAAKGPFDLGQGWL